MLNNSGEPIEDAKSSDLLPWIIGISGKFRYRHLTMKTPIALWILFALVLPVVAAEPIPLRAGPVTMIFDPDNVFLRYIRGLLHGTEENL